MMNSVKNFLPTTSKTNLYYSFFYSYMSHGILVWGPNISSFYLDKITKQQKRAVRIIKNVKVNAHTDLLFKDLSVLKVNEVINLENLKLIFNVYRNSTPEPICEIFSSSASQHTYLTRDMTPFLLKSAIIQSYKIPSYVEDRPCGQTLITQ